MAEKDFDAEYDYEGREGHTFILGGQKFRTKAVAPPSAFLPNKDTGLGAAVSFIRKVLVEEDLDAFMELVQAERPDVQISAYQIDEIASWLIKETSGRPTEAPVSSGTGRESTSAKSKGKSS